LPAVQKVRDAATRIENGNKLKQMGLAFHSFNDVHKALPPTRGWLPPLPTGQSWQAGGAVGSAFFHVLPFVEQEALYKSSDTTQYYVYHTTGNGSEIRYTFPPGSQTTTNLGPGQPTRYIYRYDYTQAPYNYGYIYENTTTYSAYPTSTYVPSGVRAYWGYALISQPVKLFTALNDPTSYDTYGYCSFVLNAAVFDLRPAINKITDGTSNTVLVAEAYSSCYGTAVANQATAYRYGYWPGYYYDDYSYTYAYSYTYPANPAANQSYGGGYSYKYNPSISPVAGKTFQVRPTVAQCDGSVPQGLSSGGCQVLLGDGSIRNLAMGMTPTTWNAALSPMGGETLGNDW
jgi:hypothetical protein